MSCATDRKLPEIPDLQVSKRPRDGLNRGTSTLEPTEEQNSWALEGQPSWVKEAETREVKIVLNFFKVLSLVNFIRPNFKTDSDKNKRWWHYHSFCSGKKFSAIFVWLKQGGSQFQNIPSIIRHISPFSDTGRDFYNQWGLWLNKTRSCHVTWHFSLLSIDCLTISLSLGTSVSSSIFSAVRSLFSISLYQLSFFYLVLP